jgi:signal transduction histidine kinase/CheY-like chemotaxis protein
VSNVFVSPVSGEPIVDVGVPVERGGVVKYVLVAGVAPAVFGDLLQGQHVRDVAGVFDADYRFVARGRDMAKYIGQQPVGPLLDAMRQRPDAGIGRFESYDRQAVYTTWRRSRMGWTVAVAVPAGAVEAPLRRPLLLLASALAGLLVVGVVSAGFVARRLSRAIDGAAVAAERMTRGEPVAPAASSVTEVTALVETIQAGSALLRRAETVRMRLLAQEQEARGRAEAANRAKDEFLAMLGHELRNPLNVIRAGLVVLDRTASREGPHTRTRRLMGRQLEHLTGLVDDMLDVTRVTSGKVVLTRRTVDLAAIVAHALDALADAGRLGQHAVHRDLQPAWVDADETRIEQVVVNLIANAIKFTPSGGSITATVLTEGPEAVLRVEDTGVGIAVDLLPRIFELFVQADHSLDRSQGGLGLGLTLARQLVEMHGGRIAAASEGPGRGATFTVRLPRVAPAPRPGSAVPAMPTAARPARVLIVEDNADGREVLRAMLELNGHEVHEAPDGTTGIERVLALRPDTAIIDIGLPGADGYEVARRIRSALPDERIRLVALTGYGRDEDRRRAAAAGFDAHLVKPVDPDKLAEVLAAS